MSRLFVYLALISAITVFVFGITFASAQKLLLDKDVSDILTPTDHRKSFGYCPVDTDTETILTKYNVQFDIESCPMARVYIDNWDKLDDSTKQAIVDELALKGFRIEKE